MLNQTVYMHLSFNNIFQIQIFQIALISTSFVHSIFPISEAIPITVEFVQSFISWNFLEVFELGEVQIGLGSSWLAKFVPEEMDLCEKDKSLLINKWFTK